jgi:hypothetical protein
VSNGWKLGVLKRRRAFLAARLERSAEDQVGTKMDQREHDALAWAIETLDPLVPR